MQAVQAPRAIFIPFTYRITPHTHTHIYFRIGSNVGCLLIRVFLQSTRSFARWLFEHQPATPINLWHTHTQSYVKLSFCFVYTEQITNCYNIPLNYHYCITNMSHQCYSFWVWMYWGFTKKSGLHQDCYWKTKHYNSWRHLTSRQKGICKGQHWFPFTKQSTALG